MNSYNFTYLIITLSITNNLIYSSKYNNIRMRISFVTHTIIRVLIVGYTYN